MRLWRRSRTEAQPAMEAEPPAEPYRWFFKGARSFAEIEARIDEILNRKLAEGAARGWGYLFPQSLWEEILPMIAPELEDVPALAGEPSLELVAFADFVKVERNLPTWDAYDEDRLEFSPLLRAVSDLLGVKKGIVEGWREFKASEKLGEALRKNRKLRWADVVGAHPTETAVYAGAGGVDVSRLALPLMRRLIEQRVRFMLDARWEGVKQYNEAQRLRRQAEEQAEKRITGAQRAAEFAAAVSSIRTQG